MSNGMRWQRLRGLAPRQAHYAAHAEDDVTASADPLPTPHEPVLGRQLVRATAARPERGPPCRLGVAHPDRVVKVRGSARVLTRPGVHDPAFTPRIPHPPLDLRRRSLPPDDLIGELSAV